jgi:hypothetical protein
LIRNRNNELSYIIYLAFWLLTQINKMEDELKYLLFNSVNSLYNKAFKFHRLKDSVFISIKSIEESIRYTEKLFPGDDLDKKIVRQEKEMYFKIANNLLKDRLYDNIKTNNKIIFIYKPNKETNTNELFNFYFLEDDSQLLNLNYYEFPNKIKNDANDFDNFYGSIDINYDEL